MVMMIIVYFAALLQTSSVQAGNADVLLEGRKDREAQGT